MNRCRTCGVEKPPEDFHRMACRESGYRTDCKQCACAYSTAYKKANPEASRAATAAYRTSYPGACRCTWKELVRRCQGKLAKSRHIYQGLPYCTWEEFWAWAQLPMNRKEWRRLTARARRSGLRGDGPSIDRLSSHVNVGYVPGNIRWASHRDNSGKATLQRWHGRAAVSPYYTREKQFET